MKVGFSFSPGGLLLPYHLGVLQSLQEYGHYYLTPDAPLAGASAGAIAVTAHATGLDARRVLDWTVDICEHCNNNNNNGNGGVRGRLLPLLKHHLHRHIGPDQFARLQERDAIVGIAYKELYPQQRNVLQTAFDSRQDLVTAVCHSSMFPFFTSQFPWLLDVRPQKGSNNSSGMRLVVDGVFTTPLERLGCPDLFEYTKSVDTAIAMDREVRVSVLPQALLGKNKDDDYNDNVISPSWNGAYQLGRLARLAVQGSNREELTWLFEAGMQDAERWCRRQDDKKQQRQRTETLVMLAVGRQQK